MLNWRHPTVFGLFANIIQWWFEAKEIDVETFRQTYERRLLGNMRKDLQITKSLWVAFYFVKHYFVTLSHRTWLHSQGERWMLPIPLTMGILGYVSQHNTKKIYIYIFRTIKASSGEYRLWWYLYDDCIIYRDFPSFFFSETYPSILVISVINNVSQWTNKDIGNKVIYSLWINR